MTTTLNHRQSTLSLRAAEVLDSHNNPSPSCCSETHSSGVAASSSYPLDNILDASVYSAAVSERCSSFLGEDDGCAVFNAARPVMMSLGLSEYIDPQFNKCYCDRCCKTRGERKGMYYRRGAPPTTYAIPIGWCRFGRRLFESDKEKFAGWNAAFHGTHRDCIASIVRDKQLRTPDNETIFIRDGHLPDQFFYFTTPSTVYAAFGLYAEPFWFEGNIWQILVQVLQKPGSFSKGFETSGLGMVHLDPGFPNHEVEWKSAKTDSNIVYGVLIRQIPNVEPEGLIYPHGTFFRIQKQSWFQPFDGSPPFFPSTAGCASLLEEQRYSGGTRLEDGGSNNKNIVNSATTPSSALSSMLLQYKIRFAITTSTTATDDGASGGKNNRGDENDDERTSGRCSWIQTFANNESR